MTLARLCTVNADPTSPPLALEPLAESSVGDGASPRELDITSADIFLEQAAREYGEGTLDQALWARASERCAGDESLTIAAYLRSRATALRLQQRERRAAAAATKPVTDRHASLRNPPSRAGNTVAHSSWITPRRLAFATAGAAVPLCVAAVLWLVAPSPERSHVSVPAASAASSPSRDAAADQRASAQPKTATPVTGASAYEVRHEAKVQQLKSAGNWNVLVLYASDWTRKEPDNGLAWNELSMGYAELRQFDDALEAASKAARLAPANARVWENLGNVNLKLDRLAEARIAFDAVLAAVPDHAGALCGAATVAHKDGRPKEAAALGRRVESLGGTCALGAEVVALPARR